VLYRYAGRNRALLSEHSSTPASFWGLWAPNAQREKAYRQGVERFGKRSEVSANSRASSAPIEGLMAGRAIGSDQTEARVRRGLLHHPEFSLVTALIAREIHALRVVTIVEQYVRGLGQLATWARRRNKSRSSTHCASVR